MSNSVDQRIVEMQFDSSQFEKGIESTLSALKNLDSSLKLENGDKGLEAMNRNLTDISKNVEEATSKFSVMGAAAFTAVNKVTSSLMDMGSNTLKAVTVQPLLDGLDEYNLKMNSIKTIQTNTGASIEQISKALDELNKYADKTIYNFADMTENIGRFTTAGVDLQTATDAIQGVSNLAAAAGSDAGQASRAMYNLSQALSTGKLNLIDWKSIENAGMGGTMFQDALKETARAFGTDVDAIIEKRGSFRDSLKDDWVTTEVLTQTLKNFTYATKEMTKEEERATTVKLKNLGYSDEQIKKIYAVANAAQNSATKVRTFSQLIDTTKEALGSGWARTWEYVIGDLQEAEELFTMVSKGVNSVIDGISEARNAFFQDWHDSGGRDSMIGIMVQLSQLLPKLAAPFVNAFKEMTSGLTGSGFAGFLADALEKVTKFVDLMNGNFKDTGSSVGVAFRTIRRVVTDACMIIIAVIEAVGSAVGNIVGGVVIGAFNALAGIIQFVRQLFLQLGKAISNIADGLDDAFSGVGNFFESIGLGSVPKLFSSATHAIGDFFKSLASGKKYRAAFRKDLKGIIDAVSDISKKIGDVFKGVGDVIQNFFQGLTIGFKDNIGKLTEAFGVFNDLVGAPVIEGLKSAFDFLSNGFSNVADSLSQSELVPQFLKDIASGIGEFFSALSSPDGEAFQTFLDNVKEFGKGVAGNAISAMADGIKGIAEAFNDFANAHGDKIMGVFSGALEGLGKVWGFVEPILVGIKNTVQDVWGAITKAFDDAGFSFEPFIKFFEGLGKSIGTFMDNVGENGLTLETIGRFISDIKNNFGSLGSDILPSLEKFVDGVGKNIGELEGPIKDVIDWVGKITEPLSTLSQNFENNAKSLTEVIGLFKGNKGEGEGDGGGGVFDAVQNAVGSEDSFNNAFNLITAFEGFVNMVKSPLKTISNFVKQGLSGAMDGVKQFFLSLDPNAIADFAKKIAGIGLAGGTVHAVFQFGEFLKAMTGIGTSLKGFLDSFKAIPDSIKKISTAMEGAIKTQAIMNIAISVAIIIGALIALTFTDLDKAYAALPIVAGILIAMVGIVTLFGKLSAMAAFDAAGIAAFTTGMLSLAIAVGVMAAVVAILGTMDSAQISQGEGILVEFLAIIAIFSLINRRLPSRSSGVGKSLQGLALAIVAMAAVIKILGEMDPNQLHEGETAIAVISGCLVGLMAVFALVKGPGGSGAAQASTTIGQMAMLIAAIAGSIYILAGLETANLAQGAIAVAGILIALMIVIKILSAWQPDAAIKGASSLFILVAAVAILALALAGLAMIGSLGGDLMGATVAMSALILLFTLLVGVAGMAGKQLAVATPAINAMAVVIAILAAALIALSFVPFEELIARLGILAGTLIVFVGAIALLGLINTYIPASNAALIELAIVIAIVTAALLALAQVPTEKLSETFNTFAGAILVAVVAFGLLAAICLFLGPGVKILSIALLAFGAAVLLVGVGLLAGASAFATFVEALTNLGNIAPEAVDNLIEAIKRLGVGLWEAKEEMAMGIMGIGYALISGFLGLIPMAVTAISVFLGQLLAALVAFAPAFGAGAVQIVAGLINGFATGLDQHGGEILNGLLHLAEVIVNSVKNILVDGLNQFNNWLYDVTGGLMGAAPPAHDAAAQMSQQVTEGYKEQLELKGVTEEELAQMKAEYEAGKADAKEGGKGLSQATTEGVQEGAEGFDFLKMLSMDPENMDMSLTQVSEMLNGAGVELPAEFTTALETGAADNISLGEIFSADGNLNIDALNEKMGLMANSGVETFDETTNEAMSQVDVSDSVINNANIDEGAINERFHSVGTAAAEGFNTGFQDSLNVDGEGPAKKAAKAMDQASAFQSAGHKDGQAAVKGIETGSKPMGDKVKANVNKARSNLSSQSGPMRSAGMTVGKAAGEGVAVGMESMVGRVQAAADKIVAAVERALRAKAKISSPSKLTAELGAYMTEGFALGMEAAIPAVVASSEKMMDSAISTISTQAAYLNGLLDDIDDQPVIRPVLDLTDYEAGINRMNGLNTSRPMVTAQAAGRLFGAASQAQVASSGGNTINISLNYEAGADANQMVMDIARGLQAHVIMEGV